MGTIIVVMLPAPRSKWESLFQGFIGGPVIWLSIITILIQKYGEEETDDNE